MQNKATTEPLDLTVWSQGLREKVKILKFWLLRPICRHCSSRTWMPRMFFAISKAKVIGEYEEWSA